MKDTSGKGNCNKCGRPIWWMETLSGKNIAVEPLEDGSCPPMKESNDGRLCYDKEKSVCHWNEGVCPGPQAGPPMDTEPHQSSDPNQSDMPLPPSEEDIPPPTDERKYVDEDDDLPF